MSLQARHGYTVVMYISKSFFSCNRLTDRSIQPEEEIIIQHRLFRQLRLSTRYNRKIYRSIEEEYHHFTANIDPERLQKPAIMRLPIDHLFLTALAGSVVLARVTCRNCFQAHLWSDRDVGAQSML